MFDIGGLLGFETARFDTKKKSGIYREACPEARAVYLEELAKVPPENRVYMDECGIEEKEGERVYGYAPRGKRCYAHVTGSRTERSSVMAAKCGTALIAPFMYKGYTDKNVFKAWIKDVLAPELKPGDRLIADNASFHKDPEIPKILAEKGCGLLFLPARSPDFNPIENCWDTVKADLRRQNESAQDFNTKLANSLINLCNN
jgi:transposase